MLTNHANGVMLVYQMQTRGFRVDEQLHEKLYWYAKIQDISTAWLVRRAINDTLDKIMDSLPEHVVENYGNRTKFIFARLTETQWNNVKYYALKRGKSKSWVMRQAVRWGLDIAMSATKERWEFRYDALKEAGEVK